METLHYTFCSSSLPPPPPPCVVLPGLPELLAVNGKSRIINIPVEIGTHYHQFGTLLLNDSTGTLVPQIAAKFRDDAKEINIDILRRWIQGSSNKDCTWSGLLCALKRSGLVALAEEIEQAFTRSYH